MNHSQDLAQKVINTIESQKIHIKSKKQIFLEELMFIFVFIIVFLLSSFFLNILYFSYQQHQLPFISILSFVLLSLLSFFMIRRYDFSYKQPFFYFAAIIILLLIIASFTFNLLHLNQRLYHRKFLQPFYSSPGLHLHRHFKHYRHVK